MRPMHCFRSLALFLLFAVPFRPAAAAPGQWTRIGPDGGTAFSVAAAPSLPSRVYAGLVGVFRTTDTGSHWTFAGSGLGGAFSASLAVDPLRPDRVWAASQHGLFLTTDGGASWVLRDAGITRPTGEAHPSVTVVVIHPRRPATVWAAVSGGGLFRTTDGGASWQLLAGGPTDVTTLLADPLHPGTLWAGTAGHGLFRSTDSGTTWTGVRGGEAGLPAGFSVNAMALDPRNPSFLVLSIFPSTGGPTLFRSLNGGTSWEAGGTGLPDAQVYALAVDPGTSDGGSDVYAATFQGVFRSRNGGRSWSFSGPAADHRAVLSLAATRSALFAATNGGVFTSTDHGATWHSGRGLTASDVTSVAISPQTPPHIYATADGGVAVTSNGGVSWQRLGPTGQDVSGPVKLAPGQPDTVYTGVLDGISRSTDAGRHWTTATLPSPCVTPEILLFDPATPATLYTGGSLTEAGCNLIPYPCLTFKSTDAGASWSCIATSQVNAPVLGIDPFQPTHLFSSVGDLYRSTDGGASWSLWSPGFKARRLAFDPRHAGVLYAISAGGVGRSTDGGVTWTVSTHGLPGFALVALAVDPDLPSTLYVASPRGVFRSTDSGATWSRIGTGLGDAPITDLRIDPQDPSVLYVATFGAGVMRLEQD